MEQFVEFTRDGEAVSINIEHIKYFKSDKNGGSLIYLFNEDPFFFHVDDEYEVVKSKLSVKKELTEPDYGPMYQ